MHSHLIIHPNQDQALQICTLITNLKSPHPDLQIITSEQSPSIGIDQARSLISWLSIAPLKSPTKWAIIADSHLLTTEAQQSLLKTLEDPPPNSGIILITPSSSQLLPTIISRCQLHHYSQIQDIDPTPLQDLLSTPRFDRLSYTSQFKDRTQAQAYIELLILMSHKLMLTNPSFTDITLRLLQTKKHFESNTHTTLTLDSLFLDLPEY